MSVLAEIFAALDEPRTLPPVSPSPRDVATAAGLIGWLSDPESRWIPLAAVRGMGGDD